MILVGLVGNVLSREAHSLQGFMLFGVVFLIPPRFDQDFCLASSSSIGM